MKGPNAVRNEIVIGGVTYNIRTRITPLKKGIKIFTEEPELGSAVKEMLGSSATEASLLKRTGGFYEIDVDILVPTIDSMNAIANRINTL